MPAIGEKNLNVLKQFNYNLKEMFYEKGDSGKCYKSVAKWDMSFDREEFIQEMI